MKRYMLPIALALAVLLCACGEGPVPEETLPMESAPAESAPLHSATATAVPKPLPTPTSAPTPEPTLTPTPAPTLEPTPEPSLDPVLHYRTTSAYDPETGIRRTTLDPQGYYLSVYFEVPVFEEDGEGYEKINAFFDELERQFFSPENESLSGEWGAWYYATGDGPSPTEQYPYFYERWVSVGAHTDKLVSVFIGYQWMMGGVLDCGSDSYTFRTDTGELVKLADLVDETEEELVGLIFAALEERNDQEEREYGGRSIELERLQDYALDDFEFHIDEDGTIWIVFDKYEAAHGAYGAFSVELPVTLNPKF